MRVICDVIISLVSRILFLVDVHDRIELISSVSTMLSAFEPLRHHSQHDNFSRLPYESLRSKPLLWDSSRIIASQAAFSAIQEGRINLDHHRRASLEFGQIKAPSPAPFSLLRFWSPVYYKSVERSNFFIPTHTHTQTHRSAVNRGLARPEVVPGCFLPASKVGAIFGLP